MNSLWERVESLSIEAQGQIIQLYESPEHRFPIEFRKMFTQQIENSVCGPSIEKLETGGLDPSDVSHHIQITEFLKNLLEGINNQVNNPSPAGTPSEELPFFMKIKLSEAVSNLKKRFESEPLGLYTSIRDCITFEISLVKQQEQAQVSSAAEKDIIMDNLQIVKRRIAASVEVLQQMAREQEAYEITLNDKQSVEDYHLTLQGNNNPQAEALCREQITKVEGRMQDNIRKLITLMREYERRVNENRRDCSELQTGIFHQIAQWKYQQQIAANGGTESQNGITLDKLRLWCEELAELLWTSRQRLKEAQTLQNRNPILTAAIDIGLDGIQQSNNSMGVVNNLIDEFNRLLIDLFNFGFIVENQPPQVMKLGTRFPTPLSVSLLVGSRLNIQMTTPCVDTSIIGEGQARTLAVSDKIETSGEIVNGKANLEFNRDAQRLIANFRSIQLKRIKRADKKGGVQNSECVMEEKFCLLFQSDCAVGDLNIKIRTMSLPVVVISHGSQEAQAVATITWDNAFSEINRIPFQVPNKVTWAELAQILSLKFHAATGRGLTEDHLRWLKQKAFKNLSHSEYITWNEFCKDNLPDRNFSFWDWFYEALKVISKKETGLKDLWKDDLIMGFVDRLYAENSLLKFCQAGTFLLRFSDSLPGAITIAWIHEDGNVYHVNPFTLHDLMKNKLADNVKGLEKLLILYPNKKKDDAFEKYYTNNPRKGPYIDLGLTIPTPGDQGQRWSPMSTPDRRFSDGSTTVNFNDIQLGFNNTNGTSWSAPVIQQQAQSPFQYDTSMDCGEMPSASASTSNMAFSPIHGGAAGGLSPNPHFQNPGGLSPNPHFQNPGGLSPNPHFQNPGGLSPNPHFQNPGGLSPNPNQNQVSAPIPAFSTLMPRSPSTNNGLGDILGTAFRQTVTSSSNTFQDIANNTFPSGTSTLDDDQIVQMIYNLDQSDQEPISMQQL